MEELAHLIEIYKDVGSAFMLRERLDHIELQHLVLETCDLRRDPRQKNQEEVEHQWKKFMDSPEYQEPVEVDGKKMTIDEILDLPTPNMNLS